METQPIPTFVSSLAAAAPNQGASEPTRGPRREKRVTRANTRLRPALEADGKKKPMAPHVVAEEICGTYEVEDTETIIRYLEKGKERRTILSDDISGGPMGFLMRPIYGRRDVKKPERKEPSPAKLEKIQKRREMRAEKKKAWLQKKKAAQNGTHNPNAPEAAVASSSATGVPATTHEDDINFDEL